MSARSLASALDDLYQPLQRALSCVTPAVLTGRRYHPSSTPQALTFEAQLGPVLLGRPASLHLDVNHFYRFVSQGKGRSGAGWRTETVGYIYEISDAEGNRVLAYHRHPPGSPIAFPHLHIARRFAHPALPLAFRPTAERLVRSHLPTGPVALPAVLRLAITELGVEPLRPDWRAVLDATETALTMLRTAE